jgi:hypothetical protein
LTMAGLNLMLLTGGFRTGFMPGLKSTGVRHQTGVRTCPGSVTQWHLKK